MAGAGLKQGIAHGATDSIGWKAVENKTTGTISTRLC